MDLTTLTYVFLLMVGYLGFDAAMHAPDTILETEAVGTFEKTTLSAGLVNDVAATVRQGDAAHVDAGKDALQPFGRRRRGFDGDAAAAGAPERRGIIAARRAHIDRHAPRGAEAADHGQLRLAGRAEIEPQ